MAIFLIRHTTPAIAAGICYGQSDVPVTGGFEAEAAQVRLKIPARLSHIYTSPLSRCAQLAGYLAASGNIPVTSTRALLELNFGDWELCAWNAIEQTVLQQWMDNFVQVRVPGGESYGELHDRVAAFFTTIASTPHSIGIVTHSGVIRSLLSLVTNTPLQDSFNRFAVSYGSVYKISLSADGWVVSII